MVQPWRSREQRNTAPCERRITFNRFPTTQQLIHIRSDRRGSMSNGVTAPVKPYRHSDPTQNACSLNKGVTTPMKQLRPHRHCPTSKETRRTQHFGVAAPILQSTVRSDRFGATYTVTATRNAGLPRQKIPSALPHLDSDTTHQWSNSPESAVTSPIRSDRSNRNPSTRACDPRETNCEQGRNMRCRQGLGASVYSYYDTITTTKSVLKIIRYQSDPIGSEQQELIATHIAGCIHTAAASRCSTFSTHPSPPPHCFRAPQLSLLPSSAQTSTKAWVQRLRVGLPLHPR